MHSKLRLLSLLLVTLWLGTSLLHAAPTMKLQDYAVGDYPIGGDFTLTNQDGGKSSLKDFKGKAVLLFFGFTHCHDTCPATLSLFKQAQRMLGADAPRLQVLFVSLDPRRDTPARLKAYMGNFGAGFLGLTGQPSTLTPLIERYMGKYRIPNEDPHTDYEVQHTAFVYLIDPQGKVRYLFSPDTGRDVLVEGVKAVLSGKS